MQKGEVDERVDAIGCAVQRGDIEAAHSLEDELYFDVLNAVSISTDLFAARALARAALKSKAIVFRRVTA